MQPKKVNMIEIDYGRWNEWDGLWAEGNENKTWSLSFGLKEMRWNVNNEVDNITSPSLSLATSQVGQKLLLPSLFLFVCLFVCLLV